MPHAAAACADRHIHAFMITLDNIDFSYRKKGPRALNGVTAEVPAGIHLLAGENGAGKTTLLHIIAGLLRPDIGECRIDGHDPASDNAADKGRVFLLEERMFFPGKTIRDFAAMHSRFYPNFDMTMFDEMLQNFGLTGNETIKNMSLGNRKKAQLAYSLSLGVDVLLLDEPTNALDMESKEKLVRMIATAMRDDQTVIVATHNLSDLENLFDGGIIMQGSRVLMAADEETISAGLAFRVCNRPVEEALYSEPQIGRVLTIEPADEENPTRVDWRLLYMALHSSQCDIVKSRIRK